MTRVAVPDFMTYPPPFLREPKPLVTENSEVKTPLFKLHSLYSSTLFFSPHCSLQFLYLLIQFVNILIAFSLATVDFCALEVV